MFIGFVVIETVTQALTTIWAAISAFLMIFISKTNMPVKWQLLLFLVMTILMILFTRPFVIKLKKGKSEENLNSMVGEEVIVIKTVGRINRGEVKASNGVIWTASTVDENEIPENTVCVIKEVKGNNLIVSPKNKEM